jgi:hypothetical protein
MYALYAGSVLLEWGYPTIRAAVDHGLRLMPYLPRGTVLDVDEWDGAGCGEMYRL